MGFVSTAQQRLLSLLCFCLCLCLEIAQSRLRLPQTSASTSLSLSPSIHTAVRHTLSTTPLDSRLLTLDCRPASPAAQDPRSAPVSVPVSISRSRVCPLASGLWLCAVHCRQPTRVQAGDKLDREGASSSDNAPGRCQCRQILLPCWRWRCKSISTRCFTRAEAHHVLLLPVSCLSDCSLCVPPSIVHRGSSCALTSTDVTTRASS